MPSTYIPNRQADALVWLKQYLQIIEENPGVYLLSEADVVALRNAILAFEAAYLDATNSHTRTPYALALKDEMFASAKQIVRQYSQLIRMNAGISDADKEALGLRPVTHTRTPFNAPDTSPLLNVVGATPGSQTVRFVDSMNPEPRHKPAGVTHIQLFVHVGTESPAGPEEARFYGAFTRSPIGVLFSSEDNGKIATYYARWQNQKGQIGPWSNPVSMTVSAN